MEGLNMRKTYILTVAAVAIALSGCGKSSEPDKREPGKWKTEATLEELELVNAPPAMQAQAAALKDQMSVQLKEQASQEECLTAEAAAKEDISKGISDTLGGGTCTFSKNEVSGGKIDVVGTCQGQGGQKMAMTMAGTTSSKKVDVTLTMKNEDGAVGPGMNLKMKVVSTHQGKCES